MYHLKEGRYIGYADDGILYGNDPEVVEEWLSKLKPESGVQFKPEKSGYLGRPGRGKSAKI